MSFEFANQNAVLSNTISYAKNTDYLKYKPCKLQLKEILDDFGDLKCNYYKKLELGFYNTDCNNLYIVSSFVISKNLLSKEVEYTYFNDELRLYSYSETKKNKDGKYTYYKFISFADDGKTMLHSKEYYAINNLRIEIYRDSEGYISEVLEEKGSSVNAFETIQPTSRIKRNGNGDVIELKEFTYDSEGRICSYKYINPNKYCLIENSYIEDYIISNYKNANGVVFWNRIFNITVGKHASESLFNSKGELIREEKFSYNVNGDLVVRIDKNANGEILSSKEIKYNEFNNPVLIINRNKDGIIKSEINVA